MDNMQTTKISQLPIAENITKDTILPVVQDDETQAATAGQIAEEDIVGVLFPHRRYWS